MIRLLHHRIPPWLLVGLVTATMMVLAWLVHRLVERPVARPLKGGIRSAMDEYRSHAVPRLRAPAVAAEAAAPDAASSTAPSTAPHGEMVGAAQP